MVLTNYFENSCWSHEGERPINDSLLLPRPKIDYFRASNFANSTNNSGGNSAESVASPYTTTTTTMTTGASGNDEVSAASQSPVSHLSSNGYYGFVHVGANNGNNSNQIAAPHDTEMDIEIASSYSSENTTRKRHTGNDFPMQIKRVRVNFEDTAMDEDQQTIDIDEHPTININEPNSIKNNGNRRHIVELMENLFWHTHGALLHQIYDADDEDEDDNSDDDSSQDHHNNHKRFIT